MDSDGDDRPQRDKGKGKENVTDNDADKEKNVGVGDKKLAKALDSLSEKQLQGLLALNPALQQEMLSQTSTAELSAPLPPSSSSSSSATVAAAAAATSAAESTPETAPSGAPGAKPDVSELLKKLQLQDIVTGMAMSGKNTKDMASYQFWKTQPVPKFGEDGGLPDGPLEVKTIDDVSKEPSQLLAGFEWVTMDLTDEAEMKELYELLNGHYVEDVNALFRFDYSTSLLQWALMSPGWSKNWHVGVRASTSRKLLAFISAVPMRIRVRDSVLTCAEVNFLCVHKKLRSKRLAPVLIKEITRRANLVGVWQGLYTGGVLLPRPVSTCRYFHRAINWQKLFDTGFAPLPTGSKPAYQTRKYAVPSRTSIKGFREMRSSDSDQVRSLLTRYLKRFDMAPEFDEKEFDHWIVDRVEDVKDRVIWAYVVEDSDKKITDFMSFYRLESSVLNKNTKIRAAYLFYYATETGLATPFNRSALKTRLTDLFSDTCVVAAAAKFDVFNALSLSDNGLFLEDSKFKPGDGSLHYYLFNYRTKPISGGVDKSFGLDKDKLSGIGLVML